MLCYQSNLLEILKSHWSECSRVFVKFQSAIYFESFKSGAVIGSEPKVGLIDLNIKYGIQIEYKKPGISLIE